MGKIVESQPKRTDNLSGRDRLTLFLGTPLMAAALCFEIARIWRAFRGDALLITGVVKPVSVARADGLVPFLLGLALHLALVLMLTAGLLSQVQQVRRFVRSKRG
jgi:hypothetical protein